LLSSIPSSVVGVHPEVPANRESDLNGGRHHSLVGRAKALDPSTLGSICLVGFLLLCAARVLTVDVAGIVTNDSLGYLRRAEAPFGAGFVYQGYRQVGYPLFMALSNVSANVFGWDHIFGIALSQRCVLLLGLGLVAWSLRWWSVPTMLVATSATFVVQTGFILPEGLLVPGCLIVGGILAAVTAERFRSARGGQAALIVACAASALCASVKLQYAALLALALATAWLLHHDGLLTRRFAIAAIGSTAVLVGSLALAQSVENRSELGVFEPIAERHRSKWWGAWQAVFVLDPSNRREPALAVYFDHGDLYTFLQGVERDVADYRERREIVENRIDSMLRAAGMSPREEEFAALFGSLRGGRTDDLHGIADRVLGAEPGDPIVGIEPNALFESNGRGAIVDGLNHGLRPGVMTTGPLLDFSQRVMGDHREWRSIVGITSLIAMLVSLLVRGRHRPAVIAVTAMMVAISLAMASGYTDNARYVLGPLIVGMIGGTLGVQGLVRSRQAAGRVWLEPTRRTLRSPKISTEGMLKDNQQPEGGESAQAALESPLGAEDLVHPPGGQQTPPTKSA
jgi:hypothetical protein